jgi:hypothetical protein
MQRAYSSGTGSSEDQFSASQITVSARSSCRSNNALKVASSAVAGPAVTSLCSTPASSAVKYSSHQRLAQPHQHSAR